MYRDYFNIVAESSVLMVHLLIEREMTGLGLWWCNKSKDYMSTTLFGFLALEVGWLKSTPMSTCLVVLVVGTVSLVGLW